VRFVADMVDVCWNVTLSHCGLCSRGTREGILNCTDRSARTDPIDHSYSSNKFESSYLLYLRQY